MKQRDYKEIISELNANGIRRYRGASDWLPLPSPHGFFGKCIRRLDLSIVLLAPLLPAAYFVYWNSEYTGFIIAGGWLAYLLHVFLSVAMDGATPDLSGNLSSIVAYGVTAWAVYTGHAHLMDLLTAGFIVEVLPIVIGFAMFMFFGKTANGTGVWSLGWGIPIYLGIWFVVAGYPFFRIWWEWAVTSEGSGRSAIWVALGLLVANSYKKFQGISAAEGSFAGAVIKGWHIGAVMGIWWIGLGALAFLN